MSNPNCRYQELWDGFRKGEENAVREFMQICSPPLCRLIRIRLRQHPALEKVLDVDDLVQECWTELLRSPVRLRLETPSQLVAFSLKVMNDVYGMAVRRYLLCSKRSLERNHVLQEFADLGSQKSAQPSPVEKAIADETWHRLVAGLTPEQKRMLDLAPAEYSRGNCPSNGLQQEDRVPSNPETRTARRRVGWVLLALSSKL